MVISALSAPIYAASLAAVALRRSSGFVTTPKGDASTRDTLITFRKHLLWAVVFGVPLALSFALGHHHFSMRAWSVASLIVCLLPVAIWRFELAARAGSAKRRRRCRRPSRTCGPCRTCRAEPRPAPAPHAACRRREPAPRGRAQAPPRRALRPAARAAPGRRRPSRCAVPAAGRPKNHVVVRFDPPEQHEPKWQSPRPG